MLDLLNYVINGPLPPMLNMPSVWDSLLINKRKPHTYRIFTTLAIPSYPGVKSVRICLHKFDACSDSESFIHPHAWPAAFKVLKGGYRMKIGASETLFDCPIEFHTFDLRAGSSYEMVRTNEWHSITPLEETYTVMVNGENYEKPHSEVRTTKGKDLDKMKLSEVCDTLRLFKGLL